jgi:WD40 repeat protein
LWKASEGYISGLAFAPGGSRLAIASTGGEICIAAADGRITPILLESGISGITALDFDGERILAGAIDGKIALLRADSREQRALSGHEGAVMFVRLDSAGGFYSGSADIPLRSWVRLPPEPIRAAPPKEVVEAAALSPDGTTLAVGGDEDDRSIHVRLSESNTYRLSGLQGGVTALAFGSDSKTLISGGWDSRVRVWHLTGEPKAAPDVTGEGHQQGISGVALHPHGRLVASSSVDGTMRLWELASVPPGENLRPVLKMDIDIGALAFSQNGKYLAGGGPKGAVHIWKLASGNNTAPQRFPTVDPPERITAVAFSRGDRALLATGAQDGAVVLRDPERLVNLQSFRGRGKVTALSFSHDDTMLAAGFENGALQLWDVQRRTSNPITLTGHDLKVWAVGFLPAQKKLVSYGTDALMLWSLPTALKDRICEIAGRTLNPGEWHDLLLKEPRREVRACDAAEAATLNLK